MVAGFDSGFGWNGRTSRSALILFHSFLRFWKKNSRRGAPTTRVVVIGKELLLETRKETHNTCFLVGWSVALVALRWFSFVELMEGSAEL